MRALNGSTPARQRGVSFSGFIFGCFALIFLAILGLKMVPLYMQNMEIQSMFETIANDPEMYRATPREIRSSFDKRASIDDIKAINSSDIEIEIGTGKPVLSASYSVKVALLGNVSLSLDFNPHSATQ